MLKALVTAVATLGVGKIPKAPGTWGSLVAVLIWWAIKPASLSFALSLIIIAFLLGWAAAHYYEKWTEQHDPKEIVVDELVGMWIALLITPFLDPQVPVAHGVFYFVGFVLFRLFDIAKPFPIGWIDRNVPGAFGTMVDDVAAGVAALICIWVTLLGVYWMYPEV